METPEIPPGNELIDIVWSDIPSNIAKNLTTLSQFIGASSTPTMDKATEILFFVKGKGRKDSTNRETSRNRESKCEQARC